MQRVGIGILGAANIANKNARAIGLTDNAEVVAVGSRDASKAAALLERWSIKDAAAYGSYDEVLADPRVDAVYIPLPSALHMEWVQAAAAAGKHILLEKPVAVNQAELDAMLAAVQAAGVQLMDGTMWMHNPRTERMLRLLRDPAAPLGRLRDVTCAFTFNASEEFLKSDVRMKTDCDPLGALGDLGWYCVRAILWAFQFNAPLSVAAHAGAEFSSAGVPISIGATLLFSDGRRGHFQCGFDRALVQTLEVAGTEGTISLCDFVIPTAEKKCSFEVTSKHRLRDWDTWDGTQRDEVQVFLPKQQEVVMWEAFAGLVQSCKAGQGGPDPFWPRITELTQHVLFAVERSAREGCRSVALEG